MFARRVSLNLSDAKSVPVLTRRIEGRIIPLLREQQGFEDEITFVAPGRTEAFLISLWDKKESADAYSRETYPEVLKILAGLVEGDPRVETYEVSNSTFHHLAVTSVLRNGLKPTGLYARGVDRKGRVGVAGTDTSSALMVRSAACR